MVKTFSRVFPQTHPKAGQPTTFVEQIWNSQNIKVEGETFIYPMDIDDIVRLNPDRDLITTSVFMSTIQNRTVLQNSKGHTIRSIPKNGKKIKVGDKISPRVWSGKPYFSKQITIFEPLEIVKVWDIKIEGFSIWINNKIFSVSHKSEDVKLLAKNDGLDILDFWGWFPPTPGSFFVGQIICWDNTINY